MMEKMGDLAARVAALQAKAQAKGRVRQNPGSEGPESKQVAPQVPPPGQQLPLWPEPTRAVPNGFLRSALFGAIARGRRRYMEGEQIASLEGIELKYTGQRLDQGDLDVWESVLHAVRLQALGSQCRVTSYALLKLMGKKDTGKNRATLHKRITRLRAGTIELKQGRYSYIGGLIDDAFKDEETRQWVIRINPNLRSLYGKDQFTLVDWVVRHRLDGRPLAQWLHGFFASHAEPFPIKIETLHRLCGSQAKTMRFFAVDLRKNLDALAGAFEAISEAQGFSYAIKGNLVHVEKKPSAAQRRHLAKKPKK